MSDITSIIVQAAIDLQKSKNKINAQIKEIQDQAKIKFGIKVDNKSASQALKQQEKDSMAVQSRIAQMIKKRSQETAKIELAQAKAVNKNLEAEYKKRVKNEISLQSLSLDKNIFTNSIDTWIKNNSKALSKVGKEIEAIKLQIASADRVTLNNLKKQFQNVTKQATAAGKAGNTLFEKLKKNLEGFGIFMASATIMMTVINTVRKMISNVIELDKSMTDLKKVTDETDSTYNAFLDKATNNAIKLGTSLKDIISSTADFARLGYALPEAEELAKVANVYRNVGDIDISHATESIISTMKAFNIESKNAMQIVDKYNEIGNRFAISSAGIGESLKRSISALKEAGNTIDESIALAVAANNVVQDPEKVGNMWKTVAMRIRGAKTELQDAGLETDAMAESTSKLRDDIKAITNFNGSGGFDILNKSGGFKSTYDIILNIAKVWKQLNKIDPVGAASLLEMLAGKKQGNALVAALNNVEDLQKSLQVSLESSGSAMKENDKHLESIQGKMDRLTATFEKLSKDTINSNTLKFLVDLLTVLTSIIDRIGVGKLALTGLLAVFLKFPPTLNIVNLAIESFGTALGISTGGATLIIGAITALAFALGETLYNAIDESNRKLEEQASYIETLSNKIKNLKEEQESLLQNQNRTESENQRLKLLEAELFTQEQILKLEKQKQFEEQYGNKTIANPYKGSAVTDYLGYTNSDEPSTTEINPFKQIIGNIRAYQEALDKLNSSSSVDEFDELNGSILKQKDNLIQTYKSLNDYKSVLGTLSPEFENLLTELYNLVIETDDVNNSFGNSSSGIRNYVEEVKTATTVSKELDNSAKELSSAFKEQNDNGKLSLSTALSLIDAGYGSILVTDKQTGAVIINKEAYIALTKVKIDEQIASLKLLQIDLRKKYNEESEAARESARSHLQNAQALYEEARVTGGQYRNIGTQITALKSLKKNLDKVVAGNYSVGKSARSAADDIKRAYSSANSAISALLSTTIAMLKKKYQDADDARKKSIQGTIDNIKKLMDSEKEEAENDLKNKERQIQAQIDLLKTQKESYNYQKELTEKQKNKSQLESDLLASQFDTSEAGKKRTRELQEQIAKATNDIDDLQYDRSISLQEDALNSELERIRRIHEAEIESIDNTYQVKIDSLEKQLEAVNDNAKTESQIRTVALNLINGKTQQFYDDLIKYNREAGSGIDNDIRVAWDNAYLSLQTFGNGELDVLTTLNSLALKMNDFDLATKSAANSMNDLTRAIEDKNEAEKKQKDDWRKALAEAGGLSGTQYGKYKLKGYADGGVVSNTGIAMLHGTSSQPELVLKNSDTAKLYNLIHSNSDLSNKIASNIAPNVTNKLSRMARTVVKNVNNNNSVGAPVVNINISGDATQATVDALKNAAGDIAVNIKNQLFTKLKTGAQLGY